jgi:hypothetical protein
MLFVGGFVLMTFGGAQLHFRKLSKELQMIKEFYKI